MKIAEMVNKESYMTPVAVRNLYAVDDKSIKCKVEVFAPTLKEDGFFYCKLKIVSTTNLTDEIDIAGSDSMQSLLLGMKILNTIVNVFNETHMDSKLRWDDDDNLDLGFSISTE